MMKRMCDLYADGNLRFIVTIVHCRFLCITENKKSANEHLTQTWRKRIVFICIHLW